MNFKQNVMISFMVVLVFSLSSCNNTKEGNIEERSFSSVVEKKYNEKVFDMNNAGSIKEAFVENIELEDVKHKSHFPQKYFFYKMICSKEYKNKDAIKLCEEVSLEQVVNACSRELYKENIDKFFTKKRYTFLSEADIVNAKNKCENLKKERKLRDKKVEKFSVKEREIEKKINTFDIGKCSRYIEKKYKLHLENIIRFEKERKDLSKEMKDLNKGFEFSLEEFKKNQKIAKEKEVQKCEIGFIVKNNKECNLLGNDLKINTCEQVKKDISDFKRMQENYEMYGSFNPRMIVNYR